jgi:hypothetical protein
MTGAARFAADARELTVAVIQKIRDRQQEGPGVRPGIRARQERGRRRETHQQAHGRQMVWRDPAVAEGTDQSSRQARIPWKTCGAARIDEPFKLGHGRCRALPRFRSSNIQFCHQNETCRTPDVATNVRKGVNIALAATPTGDALNFGFLRLGHWVATHPRTILIAWIVAIALGAWGEHRLPEVTVGGAAGVPGSASHLANAALRTQFSNPFINPLIVAVSAPRLDVAKEPYLGWVRQAAQALSQLPGVARVEDYADTQNPDLRSTDGQITMLILGLTGTRGIRTAARGGRPARCGRNVAHRARAARPHRTARGDGRPGRGFRRECLSASGGDRAEKSACP